MGPVHGAIVNWCGHKYGYRNFASDDDSKNTLLIEVVTLGELFQNNHHRFAMSPNFAVRWFEIDPAWQAIRVMAWLGILDLGKKPQMSRWDPAREKTRTTEDKAADAAAGIGPAAPAA
jgi:stearoyl-CoA desaturase (delta-9 desaturase)